MIPGKKGGCIQMSTAIYVLLRRLKAYKILGLDLVKTKLGCTTGCPRKLGDFKDVTQQVCNLDTLYLLRTGKGLTKYTKQAIFLQVYCASFIPPIL